MFRDRGQTGITTRSSTRRDERNHLFRMLISYHMKNRMKTITLEEHFVTESFLRATGAYGNTTPAWLDALQPKLLDLGAGRIAAMDEAGIDLQVLSLAAIGFDALDAATASALARDVNDELAAVVRAHPARLAGFAALALKDATSAASELDRCVTRLGF